MFDYTPVGGVIALVGAIYVSTVGWRLIPWARRANKRTDKLFEINAYISQVKITENSKLVGEELGRAEELSTDELVVVGLVRGESAVMHPRRSHILRVGDILIVRSDPHRLKDVLNKYGLKLVTASGYALDELESADVRIAELVVGADSQLVGRTAGSLRRLTAEGVSLLALAHRGQAIRSRLRTRRFDAGDLLLVQGNNEALDQAISELRLIPLAERDVNLGQPNRIKRAVFIFGFSIFASVMGWLPPAFAFGLAIMSYVASGLVKVRNLYKDIEWPVIVLIAGMIPVGHAFDSTGAADLVAKGLLSVAGNQPVWLVLAVLMIMTMLLSDVINNSATALVMAPLAVKIADGMEANIDAFLMGVAIAASCAFLTPIGHQSNTLVMSPGGYKFRDYWRMGLPLDVIIVIVSVIMIQIVWPL
jgi:di/tricarboxylate transporter